MSLANSATTKRFPNLRANYLEIILTENEANQSHRKVITRANASVGLEYLGVSDGRILSASGASSTTSGEPARSSAARCSLLHLLVSLQFERALDTTIAVRRRSV